MARRKYQITGCAKFFLILLILAPIAYLGASYFTGQDGIQNLKDFFGIGNKTNTTAVNTDISTSQDDIKNEVYQLKRDIERLQKNIDDYRGDIERLEAELKACQEAAAQ